MIQGERSVFGKKEPESNLDCVGTLLESGGPYGLPSEGPNPLSSGFCKIKRVRVTLSLKLNLTESARVGSQQTCASQNRNAENQSRAKKKNKQRETLPAVVTEHA